MTTVVILGSIKFLRSLLSLCWNALSPSEYERELEDVIKDETSGDFTAALLAMLKANKSESTEVDIDLARRDAEVKSGKSTFYSTYFHFKRLGHFLNQRGPFNKRYSNR